MKIIKFIFNGIFILALISVVGIFLISRGSGNNIVEIKIVKSGSMEPVIKTGSIVIIRPSASYAYAVGDIVTFGKDTSDSVPTTHRIVRSRQEAGATYYTTKGDANEEADPEETNSREIIGPVLFSIPYAGFILDFAKQPVGFSALIGVPAALVILYEVFGIFEEIKKMRARKYEISHE